MEASDDPSKSRTETLTLTECSLPSGKLTTEDDLSLMTPLSPARLADGGTLDKSLEDSFALPADDGIMAQSSDTPEEAAYFIFQGNRYEGNEKDKFLEAAANNEKKTAVEHWGCLDDEAEMFALAHKLFHLYAGENSRLSLKEMAGLVSSVAAELGINPTKLGNAENTFYRHDFEGVGELDESEGIQMVASMLRYHRENIRLRTQGDRKFTRGRTKIIELPYRRLRDQFELEKKLGKGGQGTVYLAAEHATGTKRVVKFFHKDNVNCPLQSIKEEFHLLTELDHPRVQRVYDIFEDRCNVYLISEPYMGGDLQSLVPKARQQGVRVTNRWLGHVLHQVLQGVGYLHRRHIMHCDLKEANAMISRAGSFDNPSVVVIDFGLADKLVTTRTRGSGTPGYMPPEVWTRRLWTPKGDVHALGVMIFQMFAGEPCFGGKTSQMIKKRTIESAPDLRPLESYGSLPNLVSAMLDKDFKLRPTVPKVLEAPFFTCLQESQVQDLPGDVINRLCHMGQKSELEAAILVDIADMQNLAQLRELNEAFMAMDVDNSGVITEDEALSKLKESLPSERVQSVIDALLGDDGQIAYTEFMGKMLMAGEADMDEVLWREFQVLDTNGTGCLGETEVSKLLDRPALAAAVSNAKVQPADLMALMDKDSSGQISFEEFRLAFRGETKATPEALASTSQAAPAPTGVASQVAGCPIVKTLREAVKDPLHANNSTQNHCTPTANQYGSPPISREPTIDVRWKRQKMVFYATRNAMEDASVKGVAAHVTTMCSCCWWVPFVFFMGAANTSDNTCEFPVGMWLRIYACVFLSGGPVMHLIKLVAAYAGVLCCYKVMRWTLLSWPFIAVMYGLAGIVIYAVVSDERCLRSGWSGVDPLKLMLIWPLILASLLCCGVCLLYCIKLSMQDYRKSSKVLPGDATSVEA